MQNTKISLLLFNPGDHCAPLSSPFDPVMVLTGTPIGIEIGDNALFYRPGGLLVDGVLASDRRLPKVEVFNYDFRYFDEKQRHHTRISNVNLNQLFPSVAPEGLVPMVIALEKAGQVRLYHYVQQGHAGAIFLNYHVELRSQALDGWASYTQLLKDCYRPLQQIWPMLNDDCWYKRWEPEMEMERKYTFLAIPDTWILINRLYKKIQSGGLKGFVLELDREFQVFDYDSYMYEVSGAAGESGYIAYIPQSDGRIKVKRKWTATAATEIRKEHVTANLTIGLDGINEHVRSLTNCQLTRLPVFRRKRFDVNFESLQTGNVYGIYFDICRTQATDKRHDFAQCEVEYCRTRTFGEIVGVMDEFKRVCDFTRNFLGEQQIGFRHDTYSKLDFARKTLLDLA